MSYIGYWISINFKDNDLSNKVIIIYWFYLKNVYKIQIQSLKFPFTSHSRSHLPCQLSGSVSQ